MQSTHSITITRSLYLSHRLHHTVNTLGMQNRKVNPVESSWRAVYFGNQEDWMGSITVGLFAVMQYTVHKRHFYTVFETCGHKNLSLLKAKVKHRPGRRTLMCPCYSLTTWVMTVHAWLHTHSFSHLIKAVYFNYRSHWFKDRLLPFPSITWWIR